MHAPYRYRSLIIAFITLLVLLSGYISMSAQWMAEGSGELPAISHFDRMHAILSADTVRKKNKSVRRRKLDTSLLRPTVPYKKNPNAKRIILEHADILNYDQTLAPNVQRLIGNVRFRHDNAVMTCDSAYMNQETQTFEAFSNVHMLQGDTVNFYSQYLYYDGMERIAQMRTDVRLENRTTTLFTDNLDYDRNEDLAYYFDGGTIVDSLNTLTSDYGQYKPATDDAEFRFNVQLENDKYVMNTEHLFYNTKTKISIFDGSTTIVSDSNRIEGTRGIYDSQNERAYLLDRSKVYSGSKTLEGDSIFYDQKVRFGEAFGSMCITDSVKKADLYGDYGYFDESRGYAFVTSRSYIKEYSETEKPLYLGADTLEMISIDKSMARKSYPLPMTAEQMAMAKDTISRKTAVAPMNELKIPSSENLSDTLSLPSEFYLGNTFTDSISRNTTENEQDSLCRIIKAYPNVKVYRSDVQAVCGYAEMNSLDSIMTLTRAPIMWNEKNQIKGDTLRFFFKDRKLNHVDIYGNGFVTQQITDKMYNQILAPYMMTTVQDSVIKEMRAYLDVFSIRYAQEENSDYYFGLNRVQSTAMYVYMNQGGRFDKVYLRGPVSGKFFPIEMGKTDEVNKLKGFIWIEDKRLTSAESVIPKEATAEVTSLMAAKGFSGKQAADKVYAGISEQVEAADKAEAGRRQEAASKMTTPIINYLLRETLKQTQQHNSINDIIYFTPWYEVFITKEDRANSTTNPYTGILRKKD